MDHFSMTRWTGALQATLGSAALILSLGFSIQQGLAAATPGQPESADQALESRSKGGVSVRLEIAPADRAPGTGWAETIVANEPYRITFVVSDSSTGEPARGLYPAAWADAQTRSTAELSCKQKIESFLQGRLGFQPEINLNSWYVITLNREPSIKVVDPLIDFSYTQTVAQVMLDSPGEDWALTADAETLFVSLPKSDQVAVVDTAHWQVVEKLKVGPRPIRTMLQPDGRYLWVTTQPADGSAAAVVAVATDSHKIAARIEAGQGRLDVAFSADSRYALVTGSESGSATLIDVRSLQSIRRIDVGPRPVSVAYSTLSEAFYVADEASGELVVVDPEADGVAARVAGDPGLTRITFAPNGRWGFAINSARDKVDVLDASVDRITQVIPTGDEPDQVAFTDRYAYIRSLGSDQIKSVVLDSLEGAGTPQVMDFAGGKPIAATEESGLTARAAAIMAAPERASVIIANPVERTIFYYMEGMPAPMGGFSSYWNKPRAVQVVDRGLREVAPGIYSAIGRFPGTGSFDLALLVDSPQFFDCYTVEVKAPPGSGIGADAPIEVEYLNEGDEVAAGQPFTLRFRLTRGGQPLPEVEAHDLQVLSVLVPGLWRGLATPRPVGDGTYEVELSYPRHGLYYLYLQARSLGLRWNSLPRLVLKGAKDADGHGLPVKHADIAQPGSE